MRFVPPMRIIGPALLGALVLLAALWTQSQAQQPDPQQLQEGAQLYAENCAVCHGPEGQGRVGATLAKDWPSIRPDLQVETTIRNGIPGTVMPAWHRDNGGPLNDAQIEALVVYILSWQTGGVPNLTPAPTYTPYPPITPLANVEGDPNHGAQLYAENCAVCHGPEGQGRVGATLAKPWSSIRPDLQVKTIIANGIEGSPMPAWSQANGGPLAEAEINDLTAFVISLPAAQSEAQVTPAAVRPDARNFLDGPAGIFLTALLFALLVGAIWLWQKGREDLR